MLVDALDLVGLFLAGIGVGLILADLPCFRSGGR